MTCSDEELKSRSVQAETREEAYRRKRAAELGMHSTPGLAWFADCLQFIRLRDLTIHAKGEEYGPFTTVEEALNMLILLGGGPK